MRLVMWVGLLGVACKREPNIVKDDTSDSDGPGGDGILGSPCDESADCRPEFICSSQLACANVGDFGTRELGDRCDYSDDCEAGLVCSFDEQCAAPGGAGTSALGDGCVGPESCQAGLACYDGQCSGFDIPAWSVPGCPSTQLTDPFEIHASLPPASGSDFFISPFPSDLRVSGGSVSVSGVPTPQVQFGPAGDVPADLLAAYDDSFFGFGGSQVVYFRMNKLPQGDTLINTFPEDNGTFGVIDVTPGASTFGNRFGVGFQITSSQRYICDPWIGLYPASGNPFTPGHTYAAVLTTGVKTRGATETETVPAGQAPELTALIGAAPPADPALAEAWPKYAPLREWLATSGYDPTELASASVFTVEDVRVVGQNVRDAVRGSAAPEVTEVHHCVGAPGPHADALDPTRGCFEESGLYREIQGKVTVPTFQQGTRPFKVAADGGSATWTAGLPLVLGSEVVTFAITVPTGTMPEAGWPVVLYAHDGGGNYRSFVQDGVASLLSSVAQPDGNGTAGFAVISIDTWLTGPRAGSRDPAWDAVPASYESNLLYDSPLNPVAARDNRLQSAADWAQIVRMLEGLDWSAGASPTGAPIVFDLGRVYFLGHGIGASAGPLFAGYEPRVKGAVFVGAGASWIELLSGVSRPYAYDALVGPAITDGAVNRFHPLLNFGQGIVDRTDAATHGLSLHFHRDAPNRDVLQVFAQGDGYVGDPAQLALARAVYAEQVIMPGATSISPVITEETAPVTSNVAGATSVVVVATATDPHRLLFDDTRTRLQVAGFLATAARDGRATLPATP